MTTAPKESRVHLRGFASMSEARRKEVASMGGAAVPAARRSFSQDRWLAAEAGRKGGQAGGRGRPKAEGAS